MDYIKKLKKESFWISFICALVLVLLHFLDKKYGLMPSPWSRKVFSREYIDIFTLYTIFIIFFLFHFGFFLTLMNKYSVLKFLAVTDYYDEVVDQIERDYATGNIFFECIQDHRDKGPSVIVTKNYLVYYTRFSPTFNKILIISIRDIEEIRYEEIIHAKATRYSVRKRPLYCLQIRTASKGDDKRTRVTVSIFIKENMKRLILCLEQDCGLEIMDKAL